MDVTLTKWGNSMGVRLPKEVVKMAQLHVGEKLTVKVSEKKGVITLIPVKNPHEGWEEAFNAIADQGEDNLLIDDMLPNRFDEEEWQ